MPTSEGTVFRRPHWCIMADMRYLLNCTIAMVWALWLGGLITLFLGVTALFSTNYDLARQAAPVLFRRFELYQLILAGSAVALGLVWHLTGRSSARLVIVLVFILTAVGSTVSHETITPRLDALEQAGQGRSDEFASLHGQSMLIYLTDAVALAAAGIALPAAMKGDRSK
jgi:hypothetical protein